MTVLAFGAGAVFLEVGVDGVVSVGSWSLRLLTVVGTAV